jgi:hypothetical protein
MSLISSVAWPTKEEALRRLKKACEFRGVVDAAKIAAALKGHYAALAQPEPNVTLVGSFEAARAAGDAWAARAARAARAPRAAWDAWDAWDARTAWAARAAWDAWDAWIAWDAWDARATRAAWDAGAAGAARVARAARAARAAWDAGAVWAAGDASWISCMIPSAIGIKAEETLRHLYPVFEALEAGLWLYWPLDGEVVCLPQPAIRSEGGRLHCETGPAFELPGEKMWFWRGVPVAQHVIEQPQRITVAEIERESNAEVRRVLLERYGPARYLADSGAAVIDRVALDDTRVPFGVRGAKLLRKEVPGDEPLVFVELRNSTPEPDGSTKVYHLRVPPDMRSCIAAVAWTWDKAAGDYAPQAET